jgi:hypothetical protein
LAQVNQYVSFKIKYALKDIAVSQSSTFRSTAKNSATLNALVLVIAKMYGAPRFWN